MNRKSIIFQILAVMLFFTSFVSCRKIDRESFTPGQPEISFVQKEVRVGNDVDTIEVELKSNLPWRVKSTANWLSLLTANGPSDDKFKIAIQKNRTTTERSTKIEAYITGEDKTELTIIQNAGDPAPDFTRHFYVKINGTEANDGLSWSKSTTLDAALDRAVSGDVIHIGAGTYKPTIMLTGGNTEKDKTFQISENVKLIGGYPEQATDGAAANAETNKTILSGQLSTGKVYHVMVITALQEQDKQVELDGITIRDGSAHSTSSAITVNGIAVNRAYAGGLIVAGSKVEIKNSVISNNETATHCAGVFLTGNSYVTFRNASISNNSGLALTTNGGGIWNDGSTLYMFDSEVTGNRIGGVGGGIYALNTGRTSYNYLFNVTIANNEVGTMGTTRTGGGIYAREKSKFVIVNSTIYGNKNNGNAYGAGISLYGVCTVDLVNSTVSNNSGGEGNTAVPAGSGIYNNPAHANILNIYNSIVSGNIGAATEVGGTYISKSSIIGTNVFNYDGILDAGQSFDFATGFSPFGRYGGFGQTLPLLNSGSAAAKSGMTTLQLQILASNLALESHLLGADQNGKSRTGKTIMGAAIPQ
ncbi:Polymorphic membrane protein [Pseudopedobacter saltans DSM 12145]|uniref:Polymorphic membrane protein n=1 Tax=Pseudopedobacter saltans (strain ATCC 51119 / DSM 12145 / JCM 21818 / CCUG 39354 / LMG 10337 / NBRC 100064 / NCIMB 13643) TaxID=762903 RepID=F0S5D0_PSESL|nr:right-handed parallel beta-helix repeat-containing protein [Pseudopedobacter saltans]ADY52075.1 Polymorphic membrane protein [Pseudopedobacter saltans DSM 12145]